MRAWAFKALRVKGSASPPHPTPPHLHPLQSFSTSLTWGHVEGHLADLLGVPGEQQAVRVRVDLHGVDGARVGHQGVRAPCKLASVAARLKCLTW